MAEGYINKDIYIKTAEITFNSQGQCLQWIDDIGLAPNRNYAVIAVFPSEWAPTTLIFDKHGFLHLECETYANRSLSYTCVLAKVFNFYNE